ncbi:hypothetical protein [Streptomyces sp. MNP-20]|uniref:hypothetical protein n=1 Tax=Streptomyces sp. MNP-20 TaxID=2721165 RepID=UPI001C1DDAE4|nr:hypothetical protein [Streptomyces sp. MNP-20]
MAAGVGVIVAEQRPPQTGRAAGAVVRDLTAQEKSRLYRAEQLLLRACMRERGFEYRPVPQNPVPQAREFPYVLDDVAWARKHGYGSDIQRELARVREKDVNQRYFRSLPPDRRAQALRAANGRDANGVTAHAPDGTVLQRSTEGCQSHAEQVLYGDLAAWFQARVTLDSLPAMRHGQVKDDPAFGRAVEPWARCMRAGGHPYASPAQLREDALPGPGEPALAQRKEIRLAVAEARCAADSGLARTAHALDRTYTVRLHHRYRSSLNTARRLQRGALHRADEVIEDTR